MTRQLRQLATTWPFLLSLAALVVNDSWLKHACPGLLSGKLSDFAGIAIVSLLLLAAVPDRRRIATGAIIAGFAWWKSPLSQSAIDVVNAYLPWPIGRTVDYTDLFAFLVIPACAAVTSKPADFALPGYALRRLLVAPVVALTTLALMATSIMPTRQDYQVRRADGAPDLDRGAVAATIAQVAALNGLKCEDCTDMANGGLFGGEGLSLRYRFVGARSVFFEVWGYSDGYRIFFGTSDKERAVRLRNDLKSRLASTYKDLEYVEQLGPKEDPGRSTNP